MNQLINENNPYLLKHAKDLVNWYAWDTEALSLAKSLNKPIFLSIGYSTCSFCDVMSQESFLDQSIAEILNEHFINIKVDRDERPDLGQIYQLTHQILTRYPGGWPISVFLDPLTQLPFFSGTYFPREASFNVPGFADLLLRISESFQKNKDSLLKHTNDLAVVLKNLSDESSETIKKDNELTRASLKILEESYDTTNGGFGKEPKFPNPAALTCLLNHWAYERNFNNTNERNILDMVVTSLTKIGRSGTFDHIGGGFFEYSKNSDWNIPHFEKTIHLNAQLLVVFSEALKLGPDVLFEEVVRETANWLIREMAESRGAFCSAVAASSDSEQGTYYLWRRNTLRQLLNDQEYLLIETLYGLDKPANLNGRWNLSRRDSWYSVIRRLNLDRDEAKNVYHTAKTKILTERKKRNLSHRDTKILTSWNGLVIRGLSEAAKVLNEPTWLEAATSATNFIQKNCLEGSRLFAAWYGNAARGGYLDDYANMIDGLLAMLSANWREADAQLALLLADELLDQFYDDRQGGFFFTKRNHENLIHKPKPISDNALPPGNATAIRVLKSLGCLFGNNRYLEAAANSLTWGRRYVEHQPGLHYTFLQSLEEANYPDEQIIIRGPKELIQEWLIITRSTVQPWRKTYGIPYSNITLLPSFLPRLVSTETKNSVTAYICSNCTYSRTITDIEDFKAAIS